MGKLWDLYQDWRDGMEFPPSHRQIGGRIGLSSSTITGWRNGLTELPKRASLYRLHELTHIPFEDLMQAAVEDAGLFDPERAKVAAEERAERRGQPATRPRRKIPTLSEELDEAQRRKAREKVDAARARKVATAAPSAGRDAGSGNSDPTGSKEGGTRGKSAR